MDEFKKSIDDGLRRIRGKIELVKKPHVSVKEWLESNISMSIISSKTGSGEKCSSTTSGPSSSSFSDSPHIIQSVDMPSKPSRFMAMNVELQDIFEDDDGERMTEVLEKGLDPNFVGMYARYFCGLRPTTVLLGYMVWESNLAWATGTGTVVTAYPLSPSMLLHDFSCGQLTKLP